MTKITELSFIIPVFNEGENLPEFHQKLREVCTELEKQGIRYEMVYINDGSTDNSSDFLAGIQDPGVTVISQPKNLGKSAALQKGFTHAKYDVVVTMDSDNQDDPNELFKLMEAYESGYDLVIGYKCKRKDSPVKVLSSRMFNLLLSLLFNTKIKDFNSGFKLMKKEAVEGFNMIEGFHRYIVFYALNKGYKYVEIPVKHHPRTKGKSKYGCLKFITSFIDLLLITVIIKRLDLFLLCLGLCNLLPLLLLSLSAGSGTTVAGIILLTAINSYILGAFSVKLNEYKHYEKRVIELSKV